jgi:hypothetical protein
MQIAADRAISRTIFKGQWVLQVGTTFLIVLHVNAVAA